MSNSSGKIRLNCPTCESPRSYDAESIKAVAITEGEFVVGGAVAVHCKLRLSPNTLFTRREHSFDVPVSTDTIPVLDKAGVEIIPVDTELFDDSLTAWAEEFGFGSEGTD